MSLLGIRHETLPRFDGATGWLNSERVGLAELRGHVALVNFWTLTCINWLRQEPYVRAWSQAYRDDGLIVVGVHTPEFSFEHEINRVRQATKERAIQLIVSGGLSTIAGIAFIAAFGNDHVHLTIVAGYMASGALLFLLSALRIRRVAPAGRSRPHATTTTRGLSHHVRLKAEPQQIER